MNRLLLERIIDLSNIEPQYERIMAFLKKKSIEKHTENINFKGYTEENFTMDSGKRWHRIILFYDTPDKDTHITTFIFDDDTFEKTNE